jgi:glycogen debranching enzyme
LKYSLANNGWIWNANPLKNFAELPSKSYFRREVIVWSDCVKLRYGEGPSSNPWLWSHMEKYVTSLARTFDGFRIDNCHSTPLHVGVALLDAARVVNPDLYVCAELFTGSEEMDIVFVSRLGINSLVRETGNAGDPKELSRLLHRHGLGKPFGACWS